MLNAYVLNERLYKVLQGGGACSFWEKNINIVISLAIYQLSLLISLLSWYLVVISLNFCQLSFYLFNQREKMEIIFVHNHL